MNGGHKEIKSLKELEWYLSGDIEDLIKCSKRAIGAESYLKRLRKANLL